MVKILLSLLLIVPCNALAQTPPPQGAGNPSGTPPVDLNKKEEPTGEEQISEIQKYLAPFVYNREDLRDPFESQGNANPLEPGQVYGPFLPLQIYPLRDFKIKGLLWSTKKPVAIIKAPDGNEYRLTIKDYIGENFGYIATIREKEVVVIQTIEENNKRYSTTKVLFLE